MRFFVRVGLLACCLCSWLCEPVWAQSDAERIAESNLHFARGQQQIEDGDVLSACESFAVSYRLAPRTGTLLNLGYCHEQSGQLILARRELLDARAMAERDGNQERVSLAGTHIALIEAQLGWLQIAPISDLERASAMLRVDGALVTPADHAPIPVVPGEHTVQLEAEGFEARELTLTVARGARVSVVFQPLQPRPAAPVAAEVSAPARAVATAPHARASEGATPPSTLRTTALVVGIVGIAASIGLGAWAFERKIVVEDQCEARTCSPRGLDAADTGNAVALASTIAFGVGVAGFGAWVLLPGGPVNPEPTTSPSVGLRLRGAF
jgi:hypothetical protein